MADITPITHGGVTLPPTGAVDPWQQFLAPCKPTLNMVTSLRPVREWLAARKKKNGPPLLDAARYNRLSYFQQDQMDEEREKRLALIPDAAVLSEAKSLFHDAEHMPAPRGYLHLGLGIYLAGMPNAANVNIDEYLCGIVDMLAGDDEVSGSFSTVAFACAIREMRRTNKFVASPAEFLDACERQRKRFHDLCWDVEVLLHIRENAEEALRAFEATYPASAPNENVTCTGSPIRPDEYEVPF